MSDIAQEIKTNIVFNAQQAIRNATELHNALQKISSLDFNNLANAFAQVGNALKLAEKNSVNLGKAITQSSKAISSIEQKSEQSVDKHIIQLRNLGAQGDSILKEIESKKAAGKVFDVSDFESYRQKLTNLADKFRDIAPIDLTPHIRQSLVETFTGAKTVTGFNPVEMLRNEQLQELVSKRNRLIQQMNPSDSKENISVQTADLRNINRDILNLCLQAGDAQKAIRLLNDAINDIGNSKAFSEARKQIKQLTSDATKFDKASAKQESSMESTANKMSKMIDDFLTKKNAGKPFTEKQLTDFRDKFYARGAELGKFTDSDHTPRLREMFAQLVTGIKTRNNFDVSKLLDIGKPELGTQNLLLQRQQLIKQMQDTYSRDRNADLSMDLAKLREINSELGKMYLNFRQLQQAKKIMEEAIAIAGNQSAAFGLDKHYKNILKQLEDANARIKQYQYDTDFNGARGKVDKYYDRVKALVASANDRDQKLVGVEINQKAKQESNFERLERKLANDVAKIQFEKDSGKTFASYDIDQRIQKLYGYATGMNNIIQGGKAFDGAKLQIFPVVDQIVADLKNGMKIVTGEQVRQQKEQAAKDKEVAAQKKADAKAAETEEKTRQAEHKLRFDMEKKNEKELLDAGLKISGIMDKVRNLQSLMDAKLSRGELPTRTFVDSFERSKERYANDLFKFTNQDYRPFIEHFAPKYTGKTKEDDDQLKYAQRTQSGIDKAKAKEDEARRKAEQKARDAEFKQIEDAERNINRIRDAFHNANITENYLPQAKIDAFNKSLKESISLLLSLGGNQIKPVLDSIVPKVPTVSKEANAARERTIELRHKLEKMEGQELQKHVGKINSTMAKVYKLRDEMNAFTETGEHPSQRTLNRFNRQRNEYIQTLTDHTGIDYRPYIDAILPKSPTQTKEMDKKAQADTKAMEADVKKIESAWKTVEDIRRKLNSAEMADKLFKTEQIEKFRHELEEARKALISFGGEHYGAIFDKLAPKLPIMTQEMANAQKAQYDTQNAINKSIARQKEKVQKEEERQKKEQEKAKRQEWNEDNKRLAQFAKVEEKALRLRDLIDSKNSRGEFFSTKDLERIQNQQASYARQMTKLTGIDYAPILDRFIAKPLYKVDPMREKTLEEEMKIRRALAKEVAKQTAEEQKAVAKYYQDLNKLEQALMDIRANINRKNTRGELFNQKELDTYSDSLTKIKDQIRSLVGIDKYNQLYKPVIESIMPKPMTGTVEAQKAAKAEEAQIQKQIKHLEDLEKLAKQAAEIIAKIHDKKNEGGLFTESGINKDRRHLNNIIDDINRIANVDIRPLAMNEFNQAIAGVQYKTPKDKTNQVDNSLQAQLEAARRKAQECALALQKNNTIAGQLTFMRALKELRDLESQVEGVNRRLSQTFTLFNNIGELVGKRMTWYLGDYLAGMVYNLPIDAIEQFRELDQAMAGVQQVMPLIENNQAEINNEMSRFLEISHEYAQEIAGVVEAGQLWGRGYGKPVIDYKIRESIEDNPKFAGDNSDIIDYISKAEAMKTTNELVAQSAILATVDNFSMMESVKGLEAILAAYGLRAESAAEATLFAGRAVDVVTKVAHYGQISAQDLVRGIEATGAAAADAGISLEFLSAMIETGSRNTGLSGSNIGNAIKALTAAFDTPKAEAALEEFGVSITQLGDDGKTRLRPLQDIVLEISEAIANGDENARTLIKTLAGGRMQYSKIMSILKDPAEILRMWGEALDSAGFAEEQLKVQMGTINAHVKQMKTEFASLFQTFMRDGGKSGIITVIDGITNALKFLEEHMTGIKTAMGAFLAMNFAKWAFGFIGAIKNMITSVRTFSNELQRAGVANSSIGAILKSGVQETFKRVITVQTDNNFSSTQQMKNITEQLKNIENQETASKNANTAATSANTAAKASNTTATTANSTANVANSTSETANTTAKVGNTAATVANRNAQAAKIVTTETATVATNALTAAELRQAAVTTIATAGINLLIAAAVGALVAIGDWALTEETLTERLDKKGKATQKEADSIQDEIAALRQEAIARNKCIEYTDKAIDSYIKSSEAIKNLKKDSKEWVSNSEQMREAEKGIAKIFGQDAMQRIKDSKNVREAYQKEKERYEHVTQEKIKRIRELNDRLAKFYHNRSEDAENEAQMYKKSMDSFGTWVDWQIDGLNFLQSIWAKYWQSRYNDKQLTIDDINRQLDELDAAINAKDPKGKYRPNRKGQRPWSPPEVEALYQRREQLMKSRDEHLKERDKYKTNALEGASWLPGKGLKEKYDEVRQAQYEFNYKEIEAAHMSIASDAKILGLGLYDGEDAGTVNGKDDDESKSKSKEKKEVVEYKNDNVMTAIGALAFNKKAPQPASKLWALASIISGDNDPWKLLGENRTENPFGVTQELMDKYYPAGDLSNYADNARVFVEFMRAHDGNTEERFRAYLGEIKPDWSPEEIESKLEWIDNEHKFLDEKYDFSKNRDQISMPRKIIGYTGAPQSIEVPTSYSSQLAVSDDFSDLLTTRPDPARVWDFLRAQGYAEEAVAGILGTIQSESSFRADVENGIHAKGLFQFYDPEPGVGRRTDYERWATERGITNLWDALPQLQYVIEVDMPNQAWAAQTPTYSYVITPPTAQGFEPEYLNAFNRYDVGALMKYRFERPEETIQPDVYEEPADEFFSRYSGRPVPSSNIQNQPIQTQYIQPVQQTSSVPTEHIVRDYFHKHSSVEGYDNWDANVVTDTINFQPAMFEFLNALGKRLYEELGFRATITGGAEKGYHVSGEYSHENGYKVDISDWDIKEGSIEHQILLEMAEQFGATVRHEFDRAHYDIVLPRSEPLNQTDQTAYANQPSSVETEETYYSVNDGYDPQVGDIVEFDRSYDTDSEGLIKEGFSGVIKAITESGEVMVEVNVESEDLSGVYPLSQVQLLAPITGFKTRSSGDFVPIDETSVVASDDDESRTSVPISDRRAVYDHFWDDVNNLGDQNSIWDMKFNTLEEYEQLRERYLSEYTTKKSNIEGRIKSTGGSADLDRENIDNERGYLRMLEQDREVYERIHNSAKSVINQFLTENKDVIESVMRENNPGHTWDQITVKERTEMAHKLESDDVIPYIEFEDKTRKAIENTTRAINEQRREINEIRGLMSETEIEDFKLNKLQTNYQILKSQGAYDDPYLERDLQREMLQIYETRLSRQQVEKARAEEIGNAIRAEMLAEKQQIQRNIDDLNKRAQAGEDVTAQLLEQKSALQDAEYAYRVFVDVGTESERNAAEAVRKTIVEVNNLKRALDSIKWWEGFSSKRLSNLKLDLDVENSKSPFSDQEATIEYTHQQIEILKQMNSRREEALATERSHKSERIKSTSTRINETQERIHELTERQQNGDNVDEQLQIQLQILRDLNLEYRELTEIGTAAEQELTTAIKNTNAQINELQQSLSSRTLWSRFEDRSLDRLKREYDVKQAGKIVDDGRDTKEYAREKMKILQQRRERLLSEYQIASQDGEMQRDRLLTQLDDTHARVVELEFRIQNGEEVQTELQTQKQLLDELNARWEDISLNGTDAERTIKQEMQETDIAIKETAQELDPVGTKLVQGLASGIQNFFSGILLQGESFKDAWKNLWSSIAQIALQQLIAMQLTKWGIGSWFGGSQGGSIPQKAHGGFVGFAEGGSLEEINYLPKFADGGSLEEIDDLPSFAIGGNILNGGLIRGAGTATSDSILTYLAHRKQFIRTSNGEYIIQQKTVEKLGVPFLDMLNQNPEAIESLRKYAAGGYLGEEMIPEISQRGQDSYKRYVQSRAEVDNRGARQEKLLAEQNALLSRYSQPVNETTNMNINAVDSKSFVQLLARHSDVLIALLRKEQSRRNRY